MLVLTRKVGQAIFIGNPRDGAVDRAEVAASKQAALKLPA